MTLLQTISQFITLFMSNLNITIAFIAVMWAIHLLNTMVHGKLNVLGIIPRQPISLIFGPLCSPWLHGDFNHLFYNSFPLFFMIGVLFAKGVAMGIALIISLSIVSGILTWLIARPGIHIGASGLIMALFGHFLYMGYAQPSAETLIIAVIFLYYFGTLLFSIFPDDLLTSFEGHFSGLVSGLLVTHFGVPPFTKTLAIPLANWLSQIATMFQ